MPRDFQHRHWGKAVMPAEQGKLTVERLFALVWASVVFAILLFLIVTDRQFRDPNTYLWVRILLSFAVAVLGATIPGFLHLDWQGGGLAVRAAGALALFALTYFFTPTVIPAAKLPPATVIISKPKTIDLRTVAGPAVAFSDRMAANAMLTVPMQYHSTRQPSENARIDSENAEIALQEMTINSPWRYFVNQHDERNGWKGSDGDAVPRQLLAGGTEHHETAFELAGLSWRDLLQRLDAHRSDQLLIRVSATVSGVRVDTECAADIAFYRTASKKFLAEKKQPFWRMTLPCVGAVSSIQ
jgi:hypothetical protein